MGHKEQLLEGAKQCLYTKGYAGTTTRDIVAASGANLASIGYHYGSKEALLTAAMVAAIGEWAERVTEALSTDRSDPMGRFEEVMNRLVHSYPEMGAIVAANSEIGAYLGRQPELRGQLAEAHGRARRALVSLVLGIEEDEVEDGQERGLGALLLTLIPGTMALFLVDPDSTPDGDMLAGGMRALAEAAAAQAEAAVPEEG